MINPYFNFSIKFDLALWRKMMEKRGVLRSCSSPFVEEGWVPGGRPTVYTLRDGKD